MKNIHLEKALGALNEAEVIFSGQAVVLRGCIQSLEESARIAALNRDHPKDIHDETQLSEALLDHGQHRLSQWLAQSGFQKQIRIERMGSSLWLRGTWEKPNEINTLIKQARSIFPMIQTEIDSLPDHSPTVYFRVFLLELKKSEFHSLGLQWPGGAGGGAFHVNFSPFQSLFQLDLALQLLENRGSARILSNPELVVRAPGEAELFAGGELPIQVQNRYYSNISWKNYGLTLRLNVTHTSGDRVRLDIFTEVSHLDHHIAQDKVPGIQTNRMKTQVDARFGTPLLLSGLLQQGVREEAKGIPFLRGIPVLGLLFGSEDYLNERSELVAILYPYATPPAAPVQKIKPLIPKGPIPFPRDWISPADERALRESREFPWNALE
jgi:Flp pilus assembly secretin CpaC